MAAFTSICISQNLPTPSSQGPASGANVNTRTAEARPNDSVVVEQLKADVTFLDDGTGQEDHAARIRVLSAAGIQQLGVLSFAYSSANDSLEIVQIRVVKPNGTIIETPASDIQDRDTQVARDAPQYSDSRQKEIPVRGLGIGDVVEWKVHTLHRVAQVPGQFWYTHDFAKASAVLDEVLTLTVPANKYVKVSSPNLNPTVRQDEGRKIYSWKTSNKEAPKQDPRKPAPTIKRRPSVEVTTFRSWDDVGSWYAALQKPKIEITPAIQAKAIELTRGLNSDTDKERAIYQFVASEFRYISISFGQGRYQPHSADEVLSNRYGDCKDKHTLLATLLRAAGIEAWPALMGAQLEFDPEVPSPSQFNHVVTYIPQNQSALWLDTTPEVAPFGMLLPPLRDHSALVIPGKGVTFLRITPANPPFPSDESYEVKAKLSADGTLDGHFEISARGDGEVLLKSLFHAVAPAQWTALAQRIANVTGFAGTVQDVVVDNPTDIGNPLHYSYNYTRKGYSDWENRRITAPLPPFGLESVPDSEQPVEPVVFGGIGKVTFRATIALPAGYSADLPKGANVQTEFADYLATYSITDGVLTIQRSLLRKRPTIPIAQWSQYQQFAKGVVADEFRFIQLVGVATSTREIQSTGIPPSRQAAGPQRATVALESAPMYSKMSTKTPVVEILKKGDQVTIDFSMDGPTGDWCSVTQLREGGKHGNIQCDSLLREEVVIGTHSSASLPRQPTTLNLKTTRATFIPRAPLNVRVYFVPIGNLAYVDIQSLVRYYQQRFGLTVTPLPAIALDGYAFNLNRKQNEAERLIQSMQAGYPDLARDGRSILIGITEVDIYTSSERWTYAFAFRNGKRFAVVSGARMDLPHFEFGVPTDASMLHRNLAKMLSREIGFLYYGLPVSSNPRSVVGPTLDSTEDLNQRGEDF